MWRSPVKQEDKEEDPELFEPESSSDTVPPGLSTTLGNQDGDETRASAHGQPLTRHQQLELLAQARCDDDDDDGGLQKCLLKLCSSGRKKKKFHLTK